MREYSYYINRKTKQIAYYKGYGYMEEGDVGYRKSMQGAWDLETGELICRNYDNIIKSLNARGFEGASEEEVTSWKRDKGISDLLGHSEKIKKQLFDSTKDDAKEFKRKKDIKEAYDELNKKFTKKNLMKYTSLVHSYSRKHISLDNIEKMIF